MGVKSVTDGGADPVTNFAGLMTNVADPVSDTADCISTGVVASQLSNWQLVNLQALGVLCTFLIKNNSTDGLSKVL